MASPSVNDEEAGDYSMALAEYNDTFKTDITDLRDLQKRALKTLSDGKDCICSLPTGYGKSLIYELLPFIDHGCLVVIIAPLNAIMDQQVQKLGDMALKLSKSCDKNKLKRGEVSYVFSHPEDILQNEEINDIFTSETISHRKIFLIVDEAHCILELGDDFRPDFRKLSHLISLAEL